MTSTTELDRKPSKKLRKAILNVIGSFQKTSVLIEQVFAIGRVEGFTDIEIGNMVRKEMLAAGYNLRTIRRALPLTSKQIQKTRKDYSDEDILSSSEHKNEVCTQSTHESESDISLESTNKVRDSEFEEKVPTLPTRELLREPVYQESITEQQSNISTVEQHQETIKGIGEGNIKFGLAKISKLSEDTSLLKFELPIPKDIIWQYAEDSIGEDHDSQFWVNGIMKQDTGKILSLAFGRSDIHQT